MNPNTTCLIRHKPDRTRLRCTWLTLCLVLSWGGCSWTHPKSDPVRYYILDSPESAMQASGDKQVGAVRVLLLPIELPSYLQSKNLAIRVGSNEIQYSDFDQWGEHLDQGIARLLDNSLIAATNVLAVTHQRVVGTAPDWQIKVRILSCEGVMGGSSAGSIRFEMTWEITSPAASAPVVHHGRYQAPFTRWNGKNDEELAHLLSDAVVAAAVRMAIEIPLFSSVPGPTNRLVDSVHLPL